MVQSLRRSKSFRILFNSPELVEEQRSGFHHFLKHGIAEELSKISFLEVKRQHVDIEVFLDASTFQLIAPDDNSRNCIIKMKTYACKLYVQTKIVWKKKSGDILMQTEPEWVLLAHLPMMTKRGHFVINGSPRVIVHQVVRAPGVYFQRFRKVKKDERNKARFYGDIIPRKGVWVRLQISKTGQVEIKLKKSTKVQAEMVERCLAVIEKQELSRGVGFGLPKLCAKLVPFERFLNNVQRRQSLRFSAAKPGAGYRPEGSIDDAAYTEACFGFTCSASELALCAHKTEGFVRARSSSSEAEPGFVRARSSSWSKQNLERVNRNFRPRSQHMAITGISKAAENQPTKNQVGYGKHNDGGAHRFQSRTFVIRALDKNKSAAAPDSAPTVGPELTVFVKAKAEPKKTEHIKRVNETDPERSSGKPNKTRSFQTRAPLELGLGYRQRRLPFGFAKCSACGREHSSRWSKQNLGKENKLCDKFARAELKGDDRAFTNVYDNLYRVPEMKELEDKMYPKGCSIQMDTEFKRDFSYKHIFATFKAPWRYNLGEVGREKLNKKFGLYVTDNQLTSLDVQAARNWLYRLRDGKEIIDDIDHSQNRRVRQSGELIQSQFENGVTRLRKLVRRKLRTPTFESFPFTKVEQSRGYKTEGPKGVGLQQNLRFVHRLLSSGPTVGAEHGAGFVRARGARVRAANLSQRLLSADRRPGAEQALTKAAFDNRPTDNQPSENQQGVLSADRRPGAEQPSDNQLGNFANFVQARLEKYARPEFCYAKPAGSIDLLSADRRPGAEHGYFCKADARKGAPETVLKLTRPLPKPSVLLRLGLPPRLLKKDFAVGLKKSFSRVNLGSVCFCTLDKPQQIPQWQLRVNSKRTPFNSFIPRLPLIVTKPTILFRRGSLSKAWPLTKPEVLFAVGTPEKFASPTQVLEERFPELALRRLAQSAHEGFVRKSYTPGFVRGLYKTDGKPTRFALLPKQAFSNNLGQSLSQAEHGEQNLRFCYRRDSRPTDNQPSDNQPSDNQPSDNQPSDNQPSDNQPSDNQPSVGYGDGDGDGDGDGNCVGYGKQSRLVIAPTKAVAPSGSELFSTKPINGALREFFGSNPLSQYMDQTNPLAEVTHKRRISCLGIGGVSRESAGMAIRGIHPTHYGRICPIETPEGKNAGLVNSLALYARINKHGFIETPYYKVIKGQVQEELGFSFYSARKEIVDRLHLAPSDLQQSQANMLGTLTRASLLKKKGFIYRHNYNNKYKNPLMAHNKTGARLSLLLLLAQSASLQSAHEGFVRLRSANKTGGFVRARSSSEGYSQRRLPSPDSAPTVGPELSKAGPRSLSLSLLRAKLELAATFSDSGCLVPVRVADTLSLLDVFKKVSPYEVDCIGISPVQILSVATSLIPFLEHNDANRALMGSNMQRQAVPLMISERPIVGTGLETLIAAESGQLIQSSLSGLVSHVSANKIIIERLINTAPDSAQLSKAGSGPLTSPLQRGFANKSEPRRLYKNVGPLGVSIMFGKPKKVTLLLAKPSDRDNLDLGNRVGNCPKVGKVGYGCQKRFKTNTCKSNPDSYSYSRKALTKPKVLCVRSRAGFVKAWFCEAKLTKMAPFVHSLRSFSRSNQETCLTQKPLVQEGDWVQKGDILTDCSASEKGELAVGKNVLIAYLPWEGYNFEDAIVVSDRLTKEQIYASLHIERYVCEAQDIKEKITNSNEWFTRNLPGVHPKLVSHLDTFGFPKIGTILKEGDILVGKMRYFRNKPTTPYEKLLSDILGDGHFSVSLTSLRVPKGVHEARVISHRVVKTFRSPLETTFTGVSRPAGTPKMVHIFLGEKRSIQIGDKMSGRHGNKGIISTILPKQDMPYLPDGAPIDILLNPLGVPSRMNVGQIFESLLGLASTYLNQNFKITAFDELYGVEASQSLVYLKLYQARLQSGQNWLFQINFPGKTRLIDGRSGECFDQWVTVGRAYMLKLIHMVNDKIHARNTGPYALITQQPLRGRSQKGGQRLGEMEVWALEGYGAAYVLQELLTKKSDDFAGRQEIINSLVVRSDRFSSPDNPYRDYSNPDDPYQRFSDPDNPYQVIQETRLVLGHPEIFKTLICELQALCLDVGVYALKKESFQREYLGIVN
jgi:DNA-directed RNA polymerase beta subunit